MNLLRKIKRKIKRVFVGRSDRNTSSRVWREMYSKHLAEMIKEPDFNKIQKIYLLTSTEANDKNYQDIMRYINRRNFFCMTFLRCRMEDYEDELGETIGTNLFNILLLIDSDNQYYIAVVYVQFIGEYKMQLRSVTKVKPFFYRMFEGRSLIYPV